MTLLPLISRELRAQAEQPFTYALRVLGGVALLVGGFLLASGWTLLPMQGAALFGRLHLILFGAIWILVPLGAADCLSRERREGTLPLLFLTPLKPGEIVVAKSIAHGLRALTLLVAALPALTIPFLMGGVSLKQALMSAGANCSALCWALAAALAASAASRSAVRAQVMALLLAAGALGFFIGTTGLWATLATGVQSQRFMEAGLWLLFGWMYYGGTFGPPLPPASASVALAGLMLLSAVTALTISLGWAAMFIHRVWREQPPPEWAQRMESYLCTPRIGAGLLRRWLRRTLERNPIGWLERRTWQGRLVAWAWIAVLVSIYSFVVTESFYLRRFGELQSTLGWLLMGSVAASAAGSFRRERESGVLELLLVSPLSARQIVSGRLRGLWGQFLPAWTLWAGVGLYVGTFVAHRVSVAGAIASVLPFLVLPVVGLYFSLHCRSFLAAFVLTLLFGMALPYAVVQVPLLWLSEVWEVPLGIFSAGPLLIQLLLGAISGAALIRRLERRDFPLERALT